MDKPNGKTPYVITQTKTKPVCVTPSLVALRLAPSVFLPAPIYIIYKGIAGDIMKTITQQQRIAKKKGELTFNPEQPCKEGHMTERYTSTGLCIECSREWANKHRQNNRASINQTQKNYREKMSSAEQRKKHNAYMRAYYKTKAGKEKMDEASKRYQDRMKEFREIVKNLNPHLEDVAPTD